MPGAVWYNKTGLPNYHEFVLYRRMYQSNSEVSELNIDVMPFRKCYILINGVLVRTVNNTAEIKTTLNGNSLPFHQGGNIVDILIQRNKLYFGVDLGIRGRFENIQPCDNQGFPISDTITSMPGLPVYSNCDSMLISIAYMNALNAYNEQLSAIAQTFLNEYTTTCMGIQEKMDCTYPMQEYHCTLYYYDQAGNLVKTIPPEGVSMLPISSYEDELSVKINNDRVNHRQTVYTEHRMETRYEYNSLNQLVKQTTPDHDKMPVFEITLPNGLPKALQITAVDFPTPSRGYLTGYKVQNSVETGVAYYTNDGGAIWQQLPDVVASDLEKVQMLSATVGYAVGHEGLLMKTLDGRQWYMLPTYESGIVDDILDLYFVNENEGVIVGKNSLVYKVTTGGSVFTAMTGIPASMTLTGVTYDGSNYYLSASNAEGRRKHL